MDVLLISHNAQSLIGITITTTTIIIIIIVVPVQKKLHEEVSILPVIFTVAL